ncbi:MAG: hypothetical protein SVK08_01315, partial [Halobacteriota archaeon]|nr:hypothetical protein [Halobacteriota archaeon]
DRDEDVPEEIFDAAGEIHLDEIIEMHPDPKKMEAALDLKPTSSKTERDETPDPEDEEDEPDEEEGEEEEETDLDAMSRKELKLLIKENDLEVRVVKSMSDDDIRDAIRDAMADEDPEEEEPEEEPEDEPEDEGKEGDPECPHGYTFGVDAEQKPECNDCDLWDECTDKLAESGDEEEPEPEPEKPKKTKKSSGKKKPPILRKKRK